MSYGVRAVHTPELKGEFSGPVPYACRVLLDRQIAAKGEIFVMTAGVPFGTPGSTNILRVAWVE